MSDAVLVDVEARVREFVAVRRPVLEQLVREAVDQELERLVDAELAHRGNGANSNVTSSVHSPASSPALCARCGERPRAKHRTTCSRCRARERRTRARAAKPADDVPRPAPIAQTN